MLKTDRGVALSLIDDKRGNNAFLCENEIESKIQISVCFFHFDPKIMIQMNMAKGLGVGLRMMNNLLQVKRRRRKTQTGTGKSIDANFNFHNKTSFIAPKEM